MIDWRLAERVAFVLSREEAHSAGAIADLQTRVDEAASLIATRTGLDVDPASLPRAEVVDRRAWVRTNLAGMRPMLEPLSAKLGRGTGPLSGPTRALGGAVIGAELGVALGFLSTRVLGQYELVLLDPTSTPRLLFVGSNLRSASAKLSVAHEEFVSWVILHEVTHALQFSGVPWLRDHLAGLVRELLDSLDVSVDGRRALRLPAADDVKALVDALRRGDLLSVVANESQQQALAAIQSAMAVVEGHAEHVMDDVGRETLPSLDSLRRALDQRRARERGPARLVSRLLGLDLKLRQYVEGKRFCDAIAAAAGSAAFSTLWSSPGALPSQEELKEPERWLLRTGVPPLTA